MQTEMELGGSKLFFVSLGNNFVPTLKPPLTGVQDLFVAMCNHIDDVVEIT